MLFRSRELPIEGITSDIILEKVTISNKTLCRKEMVLPELQSRKIEVLLTLGAGDIDQLVAPIRDYYLTSDRTRKQQ